LEENKVVKKIEEEGGFRTSHEREAANLFAESFERSSDIISCKLQHFVKYIRRQDLTKLLARYEIFKKVINTKGSIIECGVYRGFGLMCWALFSEILEPVNLTRRIYGFYTFEGFGEIGGRDVSNVRTPERGDFSAGAYQELLELIKLFDMNRFLGHIQKISLIKGKAEDTIPEFLKANQHLVVSLLFLDFDLYEPTRVAIETFLPRMPKGSIIAFDELDNPIWPGETLALLETKGINKLKIERLDFDPYIGYAMVE
jgi:hypothetical protein